MSTMETTKQENNLYNKEYYDLNKSYMNVKSKQYHEKHKETIKQRAQERIPCPVCNKLFSRNYLPNHQKGSSCKKPIVVEDKEEDSEEEGNETDVETVARILVITRKRAAILIDKYQNEC
jgi:hypothetical protein